MIAEGALYTCDRCLNTEFFPFPNNPESRDIGAKNWHVGVNLPGTHKNATLCSSCYDTLCEQITYGWNPESLKKFKVKPL